MARLHSSCLDDGSRDCHYRISDCTCSPGQARVTVFSLLENVGRIVRMIHAASTQQNPHMQLSAFSFQDFFD